MLLNKYDPAQIEELVKEWMRSGFLKPPDLARKSLKSARAQQDVDRIIEMKNEIIINQTAYLHVPIWLVKYDYGGKNYIARADGATGEVIKGDIPPAKFGIF